MVPGFATLCLNPTLQKTLICERLVVGGINRCLQRRVDASGKGVNAARVLAQLGQRVVHLTQAGGDERSRFLDLATADGVPIKWVESGSALRHCTTLVEASTGRVTELIEPAEAVHPSTAAMLRDAFDELLGRFTVLVVSGTRAPGFPDELVPQMVEQARSRGKHVVLDLKGEDLLRCLDAGPAVIKPNLAEFVTTFLGESMPEEETEDVALLARVQDSMVQVARRYRLGVVLTRGSRPALVTEGEGVRSLPPPRTQVVNTIGSGDAVAAGIAAVLGHGGDLSRAVMVGLECGSRNAARLAPGSIAERGERPALL
jgi:1-phosphofructokinase family hexose kinase